jgi:hypothetical protein
MFKRIGDDDDVSSEVVDTWIAEGALNEQSVQVPEVTSSLNSMLRGESSSQSFIIQPDHSLSQYPEQLRSEYTVIQVPEPIATRAKPKRRRFSFRFRA